MLFRNWVQARRRLVVGQLRLFRRLQPTETSAVILTAVMIGLASGGGAVVFRNLIEWVRIFSFDGGQEALDFLGQYYVIVIPAIGGLIVGPLIYFFAPEAKGHGVPEVMEAVALKGGRIRPVVVVIKSLASSITIGTGGSVGREGPIVQIGSALGSFIGQRFKLSPRQMRNAVACGAAGGIAATFNAPIAGAIFALEVILGEMSPGYFSAILIASVTASGVGRAAFGDIPAFAVPDYTLTTLWELPLYALLGLFAAAAALVFVKVLYKLEDQFDAWKTPDYVKPAIGGLAIGFLGVGFPEIFGVGYEAMENALHGNLPLLMLVLLLVVKLIATSITIGSGGSGGVFAPSLFLGAMLGGGFGIVSFHTFGSAISSSGAYALVGMAAVFAAAAKAPMTSVLIVFEMTGDYRLILPLMMAVGVSTFVSEQVTGETIYTLKLCRRGVTLTPKHEVDVMNFVKVEEVMTKEIDSVREDMSLLQLRTLFHDSHHHGFPVVDSTGKLSGVVSIGDYEHALADGRQEQCLVEEIMTKKIITVFPDEPMAKAIQRMAPHGLSRVPVVSREDPTKLVGLIRRGDISKAYTVAHKKHAKEKS